MKKPLSENPIQCPGNPDTGFAELPMDNRQCELAIIISQFCAGLHHRFGAWKAIRILSKLQALCRPILRRPPSTIGRHYAELPAN